MQRSQRQRENVCSLLTVRAMTKNCLQRHRENRFEIKIDYKLIFDLCINCVKNFPFCCEVDFYFVFIKS